MDALSSYPREQVFPIQFKPDTKIQEIVSWVFYGLPSNIVIKFSEEEFQLFNRYLYKIEDILGEIEDFRFNVINREWKNRVNNLINKINVNSIKNALIENDTNLWICIRDALFFNRPEEYCKKNKKDLSGTIILGHIKGVHKVAFYHSLGWIFPVPGYEDSNIRPPYRDILRSAELSDFMDDYYLFDEVVTGKCIKTMTKKDENKYLKAWSIGIFSKDYNFSKNDILIILEWSWNNRDSFYDFWPYPISFSRYYDTDKAEEKTRINVKAYQLKFKSKKQN